MPVSGFTHESTYNESKEWYTPPSIFEALALDYDMDVSSPGADICDWIPARQHLTIKENGLTTPWQGTVWLNPPYGNDTPIWLQRFVTQPILGGVFLCFARPDTKWFHDYVPHCDAILFVKGRIQFISGKTMQKAQSCGAASMLLARGKHCAKALEDSGLGMYFANLRD